MYLKRIIATGFKSFADKINIELQPEITGIVGPNGSGKSNVVDAIRWVLGEQSIKSLRGDGNMTEVIFSGSKSRKPLGQASVTLIFDNKDKYLPLDYEEVSITRRVFRDATNEYLINNEQVRLKDITNLLLDSGIAKESFNIISQGKVEEIISSKPESRRVIFEEAASVLKYRKRKEEALRKLDRTHDNMNRVGDIVNELKNQVDPLKDQRDKAVIYIQKSQELENIEVALITKDITDINFNYKDKKEKKELLEKELLDLSVDNSKFESKIEDYKLKISKLDEEIQNLTKELIEQTSLVEKLNGEKTILLERKKYDVEDTKLHNNLVELKTNELEINNRISSIEKEIEIKNKELEKLEEEYNSCYKSLNDEKNSKINLEFNLTNKLRDKSRLEDRINSLKEKIENNGSLPEAVKKVLNSFKLDGINDSIGNIIEVEEKYSTAITTSLGIATTYVVVDNEDSAKKAINYLKENNLGRVTFFPLNIIKSKYVDDETLNTLKGSNGFIGLGKDLVKYDKKYENIISNQLGNVLVVDNIDNANVISKKINYRYKIVTIDGELLHVGGSITGGKDFKRNNAITDKYELEKSIKELSKITEEIESLENKINDSDYNFKAIEDKVYLVNKDRMNLKEYINVRNNSLLDEKNKLDSISKEKSGINNILDNSLSKEEEKILKEYYEAVDNQNTSEL